MTGSPTAAAIGGFPRGSSRQFVGIGGMLVNPREAGSSDGRLPKNGLAAEALTSALARGSMTNPAAAINRLESPASGGPESSASSSGNQGLDGQFPGGLARARLLGNGADVFRPDAPEWAPLILPATRESPFTVGAVAGLGSNRFSLTPTVEQLHERYGCHSELYSLATHTGRPTDPFRLTAQHLVQQWIDLGERLRALDPARTKTLLAVSFSTSGGGLIAAQHQYRLQTGTPLFDAMVVIGVPVQLRADLDYKFWLADVASKVPGLRSLVHRLRFSTGEVEKEVPEQPLDWEGLHRRVGYLNLRARTLLSLYHVMFRARAALEAGEPRVPLLVLQGIEDDYCQPGAAFHIARRNKIDRLPLEELERESVKRASSCLGNYFGALNRAVYFRGAHSVMFDVERAQLAEEIEGFLEEVRSYSLWLRAENRLADFAERGRSGENLNGRHLAD